MKTIEQLEDEIVDLKFSLEKYKDKEYGDKIPKIKEDDNEFIKLNELTKEECDKYLDDKYKLVALFLVGLPVPALVLFRIIQQKDQGPNR